MIFNVAQHTLSDIRDGNTYTVRKLADGNCWMTDDLKLGTYGQSITLTSLDSDVATDYTIDSSEIINAAGPNWDNTPGATHVFDRSGTNYSGNWYNWYTATATTGTLDMVNNNAASSICPKGWVLPKYNGNTSFQNLINVYNAANFTRIQYAPIEFHPAGYYSSATIYRVGSFGRYWTSSADTSANTAHMLYFSSNGTYPQGVDGKHYAVTIRCLANRS